MIERMPQMEPPAWLMNLTPEAIAKDPLPLREMLHDSLYYPGAGSDGKPVKWFAGNIYSFVYSDYAASRHRYLCDLSHTRRGFRGYRVMAKRALTMPELAPNGWKSLPGSDVWSHIWGNTWRDGVANPFGIWAVMERLANYSADHGPERFSLLYLCSEGVATYKELYSNNRLKPKVFFLIHHSFGCNWTRFEDPSDSLARCVRANPAGIPDYLVGRYAARDKGSIQGDSYWPWDYPRPTLAYQYGGYGFGVWRSKRKK